jgi:hypothetical protein
MSKLREGPRRLVTAVTEVIALLSSGLVVYISINAVTHPYTLVLRATHFVTWPTEGSLRIAALFLSVCSVALLVSCWPNVRQLLGAFNGSSARDCCLPGNSPIGAVWRWSDTVFA